MMLVYDIKRIVMCVIYQEILQLELEGQLDWTCFISCLALVSLLLSLLSTL